MIVILLYLILLVYFLLCLKYALINLFGERTQADIFHQNGVLHYGFNDRNGNYVIVRGNTYLSRCAQEEDGVQVIYLPQWPHINIIAPWLAVRFKQFTLLGLIFFMIGGGWMGLHQLWPGLHKQLSSISIETPYNYVMRKAMEPGDGIMPSCPPFLDGDEKYTLVYSPCYPTPVIEAPMIMPNASPHPLGGIASWQLPPATPHNIPLKGDPNRDPATGSAVINGTGQGR